MGVCDLLVDSPIFSYISDLSLVKPLKELAAQDFPRINSPPLVFTKSQTNSQYRPGFLQRSSCSQLSCSESPQQDIVDNTSNKAICESEIPTTQLYPGMNPFTKKERYGNKSPENDKGGSCSVTGCLNEYFKDIMVVDSRDSGNLESVNLRQYDNVHISSNKTVANDGADKSTDVIMVVGGSPEMLDPSEEDCRAKLSSKLNAVEMDDTNGGSDKPNSSTVDHAVDEQQNGHSKTDLQKEGGDHAICGKSIAQLLQESNQSMQVPQEYNCDQTTGVVLNEHNILLNDSKRQCSMRRCLQFEEEHQNNMANNPGMCNQSHTASNSKIPSSVVHVGVLESSTADITPAFCTRKLENHRPTLFTFPNQNYGNSSLAVSRPSGIGLHLNSIVSAVPVRSSTGSITSAQVSYLNVRGKKSFSISGSPLTENARSFSAPSNVLEKLSVVKEESLVCRASSGNPSPGDKQKPIDERTDPVKAITQSSPRKKRKKSSGSSGGDGCKLCNCKKSKCLKLYCDCFAAGIYCADPCSCQGCFNKPEYEDTVLEIRQKIESKNPLAFAPKVVQRVTELAAETTQEDINNSTPSSGRHKRGCSCKKSMCLKKYCECYQSSVGCSDGCRCEDCKNVFGKKEEYFFSRDNVVNNATNGRSEMVFEEKLENIANTNRFLQTGLHHPYSSNPMTPVSQLSDREKDALKSLSPERYLPSQQFDLTMFAPDPNPPDSIINSYNQDAIQETKYIVDVVSYDQELCFENSEEADDFSLHELGNRDSPSAQQKSPSVMTTTSVKVDDFSSHRLGIRDSLNALEKSSSVMPMTSLISSRTSDLTRSSQFSPGNGPFSLVNSIRWRGSPIIPTNFLGETKLSKVCDSDNKLYNEIEEDIPEILKDNLTPISALKSSSPNKKRVSPPHNRLHELGSSSSPGLRSGRKFILKSVPLSPPLTPCIDVKGNNSHDNPDCNNT